MNKLLVNLHQPKISLAWIALLRLMLGVMFLTTWGSNLLKGVYTPEGLLEYFTVEFPVTENPLGWYADFLSTVVLPAREAFAPFQRMAEPLLGLFLLFGLFTPWTCLAAGFFIVNTFLATFGQDWPWSYGLILGLLFVVFWTRGGRSLGIDGWLARRRGEPPLPYLW